MHSGAKKMHRFDLNSSCFPDKKDLMARENCLKDVFMTIHFWIKVSMFRHYYESKVLCNTELS